LFPFSTPLTSLDDPFPCVCPPEVFAALEAKREELTKHLEEIAKKHEGEEGTSVPPSVLFHLWFPIFRVPAFSGFRFSGFWFPFSMFQLPFSFSALSFLVSVFPDFHISF
jgi:hypothetical protein